MKSAEEKRRFVNMRAKGISYDNISRKLNISKPTLIAWGKEFEEKLRGLQAIEREALLEKFQVGRTSRLETLAMEYKRIREELFKRTLGAVGTRPLWEALLKIERVLGREGLENAPAFKETEENYADDFIQSILRQAKA